MGKLTARHTSTIRLIARSPKGEDGWCKVSRVLESIVLKNSKGAEELIEIKESDGVMYTRLSEKGKDILAWAL